MTKQRAPATDLAEMLDALGSDRAVFGGLIEVFLEHAPPLLDELRAAVVAGDHRRIGRIAHRLRGSIAHFSDGEAGAALASLQEMAVVGELSQAPAELKRFERALTTLIRAMRPYRPQRPHGPGLG